MKYLQNIIREAMRLYHPGMSSLPQPALSIRFETNTSWVSEYWKTLLTHGPLEKVGFNVRCAEIDTTLPRGGGPHGQDPIRISAGTQICEFRSSYPSYYTSHTLFHENTKNLDRNQKQPTPSSPSIDGLTCSAQQPTPSTRTVGMNGNLHFGSSYPSTMAL